MAGGETSGVELSKVLKIGDWCLFDKYGVDGVFSRCFIFHLFKCSCISLVVTGLVRRWCSVGGSILFVCDDLCFVISLSTRSFHVLSK